MVTREGEHQRLSQRFDELWPIPRSITGPGFRDSLDILCQDIPLEIESIPSGAEIFDWEVPPEWRIHEARLTGPEGEVYADFDDTTLAIVNYSEPVDEYLTLDQLEPHLYTLPEFPEATPYVTSYYDRNWAFCLPHTVYESLPAGEYHAYIDSKFTDGKLNYGHTTLEGNSDREVLLSTYLCHPSLANNELSGPLVLSSLYKRLSEWKERKFTYRFVVVPETIGSLSYLSRYGEQLQNKLVAGLVLTCLGGPENHLSYKKTRREDTLLDSVFSHIDRYLNEDFRFRDFDAEGSDERQYCSPGFNLPVGQVARTVYGEYDGYHNSMDTKEFMQIEKVVDSAETIERVLSLFEYAGYYLNKEPYGEPMMSKRDLYPTVNIQKNDSDSDVDTEDEFITKMMRILNCSDGTHSIVEIAERYEYTIEELIHAIDQLCSAELLEPAEYTPEYHNHF